MARGPGVSVDKLPTGRWRIRWREWVEEDGVKRRVQRSKVVDTQATAIEVQRNVLQCIERGQLYEREAVRVIPRVATVDAVLDGWLASREAKGSSRGGLEVYDGNVARALVALRKVGNVRDGEQVPGELLNREGILALTLQLRADDMANSTVYTTVRTVVSAWRWASDDPVAYPGLVPAPRDPSGLLPGQPLYEAGPAPTMAECDAVIRRLAAMPHTTTSLPAAVISRCTGLRVTQALSIRAQDVNLDRGTLRVTTGKSRREKLGRTVPVAPVLVDFLVPYVERWRDQSGHTLVSYRSDATSWRPRRPSDTLRRVWEAATAAKEVRPEVWAPESHEKARPTHAFRAAFQTFLVDQGVRDEIIDALVGHGGSLRSSHYVNEKARMAAMREAVALIPPIDWGSVTPR